MNKCKKEIRKAKKRHEKRIVEDCKQNPKTFWKYVQEQTKTREGIGTLIDNGNVATTKKEKLH